MVSKRPCVYDHMHPALEVYIYYGHIQINDTGLFMSHIVNYEFFVKTLINLTLQKMQHTYTNNTFLKVAVALLNLVPLMFKSLIAIFHDKLSLNASFL